MAKVDIFNMTDTWNNGVTVFAAIKMDVTDTASNAASLLMDLQLGSVSKFSVDKFGSLAANGNGVFSGGLDIAASNSYTVAGTAILSDAAGVMTLSNVDALDTTTESTIEAAIDTLANLTAATSLVSVGALASGSIATGFGSIATANQIKSSLSGQQLSSAFLADGTTPSYAWHADTVTDGGIWDIGPVADAFALRLVNDAQSATLKAFTIERSGLNVLGVGIPSSALTVGITDASAFLGKLHVDQNSATGAIPVLYIDQADVSEELFEFASTIGVGNAIEAIGAKSLTTTHFLKVTLPGSLTRYIPVGTIA